jgi:ssDNA thymidine ADP-ribosyltransferase, DarT
MEFSDIHELHYITHIENLTSIKERGILSHSLAQQINHTKIDMQEVQDRREIKRVPGGQKLHEYANLYFNARNPMLYKRKNMYLDICVLRVKVDVLDLPGVVVVTGNAASDYIAFFPARRGIEKIQKEFVFARSWKDDDAIKGFQKKAAICAEVLVPDFIPKELIIGAYISCDAVVKKIGDQALQLNINPDLFFR